LKAIDVGDYEARLVQLENFREEFKQPRTEADHGILRDVPVTGD
jgi:hypothetical protein